jgi:hypothetical protein
MRAAPGGARAAASCCGASRRALRGHGPQLPPAAAPAARRAALPAPARCRRDAALPPRAPQPARAPHPAEKAAAAPPERRKQGAASASSPPPPSVDERKPAPTTWARRSPAGVGTAAPAASPAAGVAPVDAESVASPPEPKAHAPPPPAARPAPARAARSASLPSQPPREAPQKACWETVLAEDPLRRVLGGASPLSPPFCRSFAREPPSPASLYRLTRDCPVFAIYAVDFGLRKTGVAVTAGGLAPRPLAVLRMPGYAPRLLADLVALALKEGAKARAPQPYRQAAAPQKASHPLRPSPDTRR